MGSSSGGGGGGGGVCVCVGVRGNLSNYFIFYWANLRNYFILATTI